MKIKSSVEFKSSRYSGQDATALLSAIRAIPEGASNIKHKVNYSPGDRPWETDSFSIVIEWEVEV